MRYSAIDANAQVAKENIAHAGLADRVEVVIGPAEKSLAEMKGAEEGSYDFAFIDAFMVNNVTYMKECKRLVKSGGVIVSWSESAFVLPPPSRSHVSTIF